jgi:NAD-dependent DNA ligase
VGFVGPSRHLVPASNRLLKLLKFFGVPDPSDIPAEEAWEKRAALFENPANKERWNKYVYLTNDVDSKSSDLKPFDPVALETVILPQDWSAARAEREYREQMAAKILQDRPDLYNTPQPPVLFEGRVFLFTGEFEFGSRVRCEQAVHERGGVIPKNKEVSHVIDYLVVGAKGSAHWKRETYGAKIEVAVVERRVHGKPAIITEEPWRAQLLSAKG